MRRLPLSPQATAANKAAKDFAEKMKLRSAEEAGKIISSAELADVAKQAHEGLAKIDPSEGGKYATEFWNETPEQAKNRIARDFRFNQMSKTMD